MDLNWLLQQPEKSRDKAWEESVLKGLLEAKVQIASSEPQVGPDGWPYLVVKTGPEGTEPFLRVVQWLSGRGIGLVVNAHKMLPDYIFTYGMLWNFVETGQFIAPDKVTAASGDVSYDSKDRIIAGAPTDQYLPPYVRSVLKDFLGQQGFQQPRVLVITHAPDYKITDFVFSVESLNGLEPKDQKVMAEALAWFLPLHYSLVFAHEKDLPPFHAL